MGVHTTQFAIRHPEHDLLKPVLELAIDTLSSIDSASDRTTVKIAGVCGLTRQAVVEAALARDLGYDACLLSLSAFNEVHDDELLAHCRIVGEEISLIGFYLQPAVGGRVLSHGFWSRFAEIPGVVAIKIAPFNRYRSLDVIRAVAESGRAHEIALYTGNDDSIVTDLLTEHAVRTPEGTLRLRICGGLLGQWACGTRRAVELLDECKGCRDAEMIPSSILTLGAEITDSNAAIFDAANGFKGCIAGIHEILRRQGLLEGTWCLDPREELSPGQAEEIARIYQAYPHLTDEEFILQNRDAWLR